MVVFLQVEVENFVLKMAAEFPSRRDQLIFLINNYDMMLSVLMVRIKNGLLCLNSVLFSNALLCLSRRGQQTTAKRWRVFSSCFWPELR